MGSCFAMVAYSRLNKQKEIKCQEEGIDHTQAELFRDMGDASPLFRYVIIRILITRNAYSITGTPSRAIKGSYIASYRIVIYFQTGHKVMEKNDV
jgi:hypothetical protein